MKRNLENGFMSMLKENFRIVRKVCCMYADQDAEREDLQQEIYLQLWKSFPSFEGRSKESTWMYKIALNTAITFFKKGKAQNGKRAECEELYTLEIMQDESELNEQVSQMYKAINKLNKVEKALVMLYLDNKKYDEISEIMGISAVNARVKINRIKEKLRTSINQ